MKKKIIYFITEDWYFVSHRLDLAKSVIDKGYQVYLYSNDSGLKDKIENNGIFFLKGRFARDFSVFSDLRVCWDAVRIIFKVRPQVVQAVAIKPVVLIAAILKLFPGVRGVFAISGLGTTFTSQKVKHRLIQFILRIIFKLFLRGSKNRIIVQNQSDFKILKSILPDTSITIVRGAGVNVDEFKPSLNKSITSGHNTKRILFASRLLWGKGILDYCKAAKKIVDGMEDCEFDIAGGIDVGSDDSLTEEDLNNLMVDYPVRWIGKINLVNALPLYDLFIFPTFYGEGVPKVLLESSACGIPIITTNTPGCNDIVQDGVNGYLVNIGDIDAIVTKSKNILKDNDLWKELSLNGRKRAKRVFSTKVINFETLEVYES